jgi:large subunit ribosomal protein L10
MSKLVKQMMISDLQAKLGDCREVLVVDVSKLTAVATNKWRISLFQKKIRVHGVKNAVARRALIDVGLGGVADVLKGPSAIIWGGEDIVSLAREIVANVKATKEIELKGGALGATSLSADQVEQLSKSPGRAELLSQISGLVLGTGGRLAAAIAGPGGRVAGCAKAIADKTEDATAA